MMLNPKEFPHLGFAADFRQSPLRGIRRFFGESHIRSFRRKITMLQSPNMDKLNFRF
jgi:hypothetical protein